MFSIRNNCLCVFTAKISIDSDTAEIISPEIYSDIGKSKVSLINCNGNFYIYIEAPDIGSLRASFGSIARIFHVIKNVEVIIDG